MPVTEDIADLEDLSNLLSADLPAVYSSLEQAQLVIQEIMEWLPTLNQLVQELRLAEIAAGKLEDPGKRKVLEQSMEERVERIFSDEGLDNIRAAVNLLPQLLSAPSEPLAKLVAHPILTR